MYCVVALYFLCVVIAVVINFLIVAIILTS